MRGEETEELSMHASQRFIKGPQRSLSSKLSGKSLNFWRRREIICPYGWHHCIYSECNWGGTRWYKGGSKGAAILLLRLAGILNTSLLDTQLTATLAIQTHDSRNVCIWFMTFE